jgi:hypothetical protein
MSAFRNFDLAKDNPDINSIFNEISRHMAKFNKQTLPKEMSDLVSDKKYASMLVHAFDTKESLSEASKDVCL